MNHINEAEKQGIIVIVLNSSASASTLALEFLNANKVLTLREGRPVEEWVGQGAYKIYKLANSDRKATEILVHLNEVAGTASIYGIINKFGTDNDKANTNIVTARPG